MLEILLGLSLLLLGQKAKRGVGAVHTECMLGCWWPFFQKDICMNVGAELLCLVHHHSKEIDDMVLDLFDRSYFWLAIIEGGQRT